MLNICGIPTVIEPMENPEPTSMGRWIECEAKILVNSSMHSKVIEATIWHEAVHALLSGIGRVDLCNDEQFVEAFSRALYQMAGPIA